MYFKMQDGKTRFFAQSHFFPGVFIETHSSQHANFFSETELDLMKLRSTSNGYMLQTSILRYMNGEKFILIYYTSGHSFATPRLTATQRGLLSDQIPPYHLYGRSVDNNRRGEGASAEVAYNSRESSYLDPNGNISLYIKKRDNQFIILMHELIHACRILKGTSRADFGLVINPLSGQYNEEMRTVGIGKWKDKRPSENSLRQELGLPLRLSHSGMYGNE